jgi:hypothetical protein
MNRSVCISFVLMGLLGSGCAFDEELVIENLVGTVVVPEELIQRDFEVDGQVQTVADPRVMGPVYLGLYPGAVGADVITDYPHPTTGPVFDPSQPIGTAYPYGGTTVGLIRPVCLEALQCRAVSGRFTTYDAMIAWYRDYLNEPILDWNDDPIESGEELRQICMNTFEFTLDEELGFVVGDRNGDDTVDEMDLDFIDRGDGHWEAEFTIWQQEYFRNPESGEGFTLWGVMDNPDLGNNTFGSCSTTTQVGQFISEYNQRFRSGAMVRDFLNRPSQYINTGDIVSGPQDQEGGAGDVGYIYQDEFDVPELFLNFEVQ